MRKLTNSEIKVLAEIAGCADTITREVINMLAIASRDDKSEQVRNGYYNTYLKMLTDNIDKLGTFRQVIEDIKTRCKEDRELANYA